MTSEKNNLERLIECERIAKEQVTEARSEYIKMRAKARIDAEKELSHLRSKREEEIKELEVEMDKKVERTRKELDLELEKKLKSLESVESKIDEVVDVIVRAVLGNN